MIKKNAFLFVLGLFLLTSFVNGATFYDSFQFTFDYEKPSTMKILSYKCLDVDCTKVENSLIEFYKGDSVLCWDNFGSKGDTAGYTQCMAGYKLSGNTLDLNDCSTIGNDCSGNVNLFIKYDTANAPFGFVNYFFTSGDTYIPNYFRQTAFTCEYDVCVNVDNVKLTNFVRKANAVAEIQQLNIKNVDNPLLPVQIEVPVKIEQTVCSAYRFANTKIHKPLPPAGYSDFSADTKVTLNIKNANTNVNYLTESITIPILADTCAGLAAFSWRPNSSLENQDIKFRVESDVIDKQVINSMMDFSEVTERVYPSNLENACWTRSYDFTLANIPNYNLNTSIAQISQGETLYALFKSGAFRDDTITPMNYEVVLKFGNEVVYQQVHSTKYTTTQEQLEKVNIDLTSRVSSLPPGLYTVTLYTIPYGVGCLISAPVIQTQQLQILDTDYSKVKFTVRDEKIMPVDNANINLMLISADDYYAEEQSYNQNLVTDANGVTTFGDVIRGTYKYSVSKAGYSTINKEIYIGADTNVFVTLTKGNIAPIVDLPTELKAYYLEPFKFNLKDYVYDQNDVFEDLTISYRLISGTTNINYNTLTGEFTFTTDRVNNAVIEVSATDKGGFTGKDTMTIKFVDNKQPVITSFYATPDNGQAPFYPVFTVLIADADGDELSCKLDFGDGSPIAQGVCASFNNRVHAYNLPGTYVAKLYVNDGVTSEVTATEYIYVFNKTTGTPIVNSFSLQTSEGYVVPTDLTLRWNITHTTGLDTTCSLRINGVEEPVSCIGTKNINDFARVGISRFTIIGVDTENVMALRTIDATFEKGAIENNGPVIDVFTAIPTTGIAPLVTTFRVAVSDADNDELTCTLDFGDGTSVMSGPCSTLNRVVHTYQNPGVYNAVLLATDGEAEAGAYLTINTIGNEAPVINMFSATPDIGPKPLTTTFTVDVTDIENDELICIIDFGDGNVAKDYCNNLNGLTHTYVLPKSYTATLYANDGFNPDVIGKTNIEVLNKTITPIINSFTIVGSNGFLIPTDVTLDWDVTHTDGYPMTCTLTINGVDEPISCVSSKLILNYQLKGISSFTITAVDNMGTTVTRTLEREFYTEDDFLNDLKTELIIDSVLVPGEFTFKMRTTNETLSKRKVDVKPVIICGGVENTLRDNNGYLPTSAISRKDGNISTFEFRANTNDYQLIVPKDVICTFRLYVKDEIGSTFLLSENVMFSYPVENQTFTSIRGKGTDILNYMSSTMLSGAIKTGYNSVEFNVINNEGFDKEISIEMTSAALGIERREEFTLGVNKQRTVQLPMYIDSNLKPGKYPVRYAVREGSDKQVRYSYILVE